MNMKARSTKHEARSKSRGYTLVEIIVAVGLFALIMTLASGAYLMMISFAGRAQNTSTGINNLSFALETMTRTIRTGTSYNDGTDCSGCTSFSVVNSGGTTITYGLSNGSITQTISGVATGLTDPSVSISSLRFYASGTTPGDASQPYVTIVILGTTSAGAKDPQSFTVETGAAMRGTDL